MQHAVHFIPRRGIPDLKPMDSHGTCILETLNPPMLSYTPHLPCISYDFGEITAVMSSLEIIALVDRCSVLRGNDG